MLKDEIEKVLENINLGSLPRIDYNDVPLVTIIGDKGISQTLTRILELVEQCVPKEKNCPLTHKTLGTCLTCFGIKKYNQAIAEIKRRIV